MGIEIRILREDAEEIQRDIRNLALLFGVGDQSLPEAGVAPLTVTQAAPPPDVSGTPVQLTLPPGANVGVLATDPLPPAATELDIDGQPWNAEIHSSTKGKKADGRWKRRRGADSGRIAEIYAAYTVSATPAPSLAAAPPATPAPAPPAPQDPVAACIEMCTKTIMTTQDPATIATISGRINQIMNENGVPSGSATELMNHQDKAPAVLIGLTALARECGVQC